MIREVTFATPENTQVISGNRLSRMHHYAEHALAKRQKKLVVQMVLDAFAKDPPRPFTRTGEANSFRVTLTRITIRGTGLEEHDNLRAGFKHFVDGLSAVIYRGREAIEALQDPTGKAWKRIAGRDDGRRCFEWHYDQQRSTGLVGVRIRIEDLDIGEDLIVYRAAPGLMGAADASAPSKPVASKAAPQQQFLFRKAWMALPWLQTDPNAENYENLVEASHISRLLEAPAEFELKHPQTRERVTLYRHEHHDPDLGGRVWLYCDIKPAPDMTEATTKERKAS